MTKNVMTGKMGENCLYIANIYKFWNLVFLLLILLYFKIILYFCRRYESGITQTTN